MGMGKDMRTEIVDWGVVAMVIVIVSVVLLQFATLSVVTTALNLTIQKFVTALSSPSDWVAIVIIATIGIGLIFKFSKKFK